jgi:hypothetical protein
MLLFPNCITISTQEPRSGVMLPAGLRPGGGPNGARRVRAGQRVKVQALPSGGKFNDY